MCFFFKQKTAYEMRISDWSSDVCSSDLDLLHRRIDAAVHAERQAVAGAGDGIEHLVETIGAVAHHVEDRPEDLALPHLDSGDRKRVVEGQSVSVREGPGGRRTLKNNTQHSSETTPRSNI